MPNLLAPPPWKIATTNGHKYKTEVKDGHFLEVLSLIAGRLNDLNETMKDIKDSIESYHIAEFGIKS